MLFLGNAFHCHVFGHESVLCFSSSSCSSCMSVIFAADNWKRSFLLFEWMGWRAFDHPPFIHVCLILETNLSPKGFANVAEKNTFFSVARKPKVPLQKSKCIFWFIFFFHEQCSREFKLCTWIKPFIQTWVTFSFCLVNQSSSSNKTTDFSINSFGRVLLL